VHADPLDPKKTSLSPPAGRNGEEKTRTSTGVKMDSALGLKAISLAYGLMISGRTSSFVRMLGARMTYRQGKTQAESETTYKNFYSNDVRQFYVSW
jgi:hypothetical protein